MEQGTQRGGIKILDEKMYKKEIVRMWDTLRGDEYKGKGSCAGVYCEDCQLSSSDGCLSAEDIFEIYKIVEKWSKEHPQKHKVSKLEFDILEAIFEERPLGSDYLKFSELWILRRLLKKGYFNAATSETNVKYYFDNCEVKEDV